MQLIDTHQHLILRDHLGYAWADALPPLAGKGFTPQDYADQTAGHTVIGTLFMEAGVDEADYQAEARLVSGLVGTGGMLGQIASCRPETDAGFTDWLDECTDLGVLGFRRILHVVADDLSQSTTFRRNLRQIGARGLPFDLCVRADQHGLAEDLVRACDGQVFVLDHCANPDIAADRFDVWAKGLHRLAALPHVMVKLSGITANARPDQHNVTALRPYVDHVIACFGPDRMCWGGDWPVVDLGAGLPAWIGLTHDLLSGLSQADQQAIGTGTAQRIYGLRPWGLPTGTPAA